MKKILFVFFAAIIMYAIYHDLSSGTIPVTVSEIKKQNHADPEKKLPYFEHKTKPGETLLSIIEESLGSSIPVSISTAIDDFKMLNGGQVPEKIQIGKHYKFPDYSNR